MPGLAFLYVDKNLAETLRPSDTGWFGQKNPFDFTPRQLTFAPGSRRFDTGTPPVAAAFASRAGMEIINQVRPAVIEEQIRFLNQVALEEAQQLELPLLSPTDLDRKGAVTAILLDSDSHAMEERLKKWALWPRPGARPSASLPISSRFLRNCSKVCRQFLNAFIILPDVFVEIN